jgi:hypothetical protein
MEAWMKLVPVVAALGLLLGASACSDSHYDNPGQAAGTGAFSNGLRTNDAQPTSCSPADNSCGTGIGNPSIQSPVQKRLRAP